MTAPSGPLDTHSDAYSRRFPHYEENRVVHAAYGARIANDIAARGLRSALSLGIGHTEVARPILALLRTGPLQRYVVVDAAPSIVAEFRASAAPAPPGLEIVEAYFETFESAQRFDLIEAGFVLEHVDDPTVVLERMRGLVESEGRMYIAVPNARSLHRVLGHLAGLLPDLYQLSDADRALGHRRYFDIESLTRLVLDCGWRIERAQGMLLKPFTTAQLARLELPPEVWQAMQTAAVPYPEISNAICMELTVAR